MDLSFFVTSALLGIGLAMDAFSVSLANGLNEPKMPLARMGLIAGVYAVFQFAMPVIGWICVNTIVTIFNSLQKFIPWAAFLLLLYIGGEMIFDSLKSKEKESEETKRLKFSTLIVQGIATSIDALSVGFTIVQYTLNLALIASLIIAILTFIICMAGLKIGKTFGTRLSSKAGILGGVILVGIGIKILVSGLA